MDQNDLKQILRSFQPGKLRRGWSCPDNIKLAAYVDHQLANKIKKDVERHLADCDFCLGQVAFLSKSAEWVDFDPVPAHLKSKARSLVPSRQSVKPWNWRWTTATAVAACLVLAVLLAIGIESRNSVVSVSEPQVAQTRSEAPAPQASSEDMGAMAPTGVKSANRDSVRQPKRLQSGISVRRAEETNPYAPRLISPREGAVVSAERIVFHWLPVPDAVFYEISLVSASGELVFQTKTEMEQVQLPSQIKLTRGAKYFVWVSANLREGKTVKSNALSIRAQ